MISTRRLVCLLRTARRKACHNCFVKRVCPGRQIEKNQLILLSGGLARATLTMLCRTCRDRPTHRFRDETTAYENQPGLRRASAGKQQLHGLCFFLAAGSRLLPPHHPGLNWCKLRDSHYTDNAAPDQLRGKAQPLTNCAASQWFAPAKI